MRRLLFVLWVLSALVVIVVGMTIAEGTVVGHGIAMLAVAAFVVAFRSVP